MRAFITGAGGFVGTLLWQALEQQGVEVTGCCLSAGKDETRRILGIDIRDSEAVKAGIAEYKPDVIYHLAAISFVPECETDFDRAFAINVCGTEHVVRAASSLGTKPRVIFVSSGNVYGDLSLTSLPLTEESDVCPTNTYSLTKVMSEEIVKKYTRTGEIHGIIFRPFNHIGPGQSDRFVVSSFARQFARIYVSKGRPKLQVGNLTSYRDFTDVRDIVAAYVQGATKGSGVYLLASGKCFPIERIVSLLKEISGIEPEIVADPSRQRSGTTEDIVPHVSPQRVAHDLGWAPQFSLEQSVRDVFDYWVAKEREIS